LAKKQTNMKSTTTLCTLLLILATYTHSFAQWGMGKPEDVAAVKNRTLIVVVEQSNPKIIEKLKKKNKGSYIDDYRKALDDYNDNMKDAVQKYWTFSSNVEYKTAEELESIVKSKSKDYAVLRCITMNGNYSGIDIYSGLNWTYTDFKNGQKEDNDYWESSTFLEVTLIEKADKFKPVFYFGLQDIFPLESDIIFGLRSTQWYFTQRANKAKAGEMRDMIKENALQLKDKTLVARKDLVDPKLTPNTIKSVYPNKFEEENADDYDQHIVNADDGYVMLVVSPSLNIVGDKVKVIYVYYAMDAKSGDMMGYALPSVGALMTAGYSFSTHVGSATVNERIFKELGEESMGK
jgi:hypothetical protein